MLRIMHRHKFFTVFILGAITIVIIIVFIFWGIGPQQNPSTVIVAKIDNKRITLAEYERSYELAYRRAKEIYHDEEEIKKLNLKKRVLDELIDNIVLMSAAESAGIKVSNEELQEVIINEPAFQKDGVFDKEIYTRRLRLNHLTPRIYESRLRDDLLLDKMRRLIGESVSLTAEEIRIFDSMAGDKAQLIEAFLSAKRGLAIKAYVEGLKRHKRITINKEFIS